MGEYTGLRFSAPLNDVGKDIVAQIILHDKQWHEVDSTYPNLGIGNFASDRRCNFIPHGALCYMPDDWAEQNEVDGDTVWHVCCSLKNYEDTIEKFLTDVLPKLIREPITVEILFNGEAKAETFEVPTWNPLTGAAKRLQMANT